jgi:hypothetical protein
MSAPIPAHADGARPRADCCCGGSTSVQRVRREKAALSGGCKSHPATAPAGSNWTRSWEDFDYAPPDCESSRVAQIRIATEVAEICRSQAGRRIAISSHGNVIGLLLNSLDAAFHRPHTEQLRNPDLLRLLYANSELRWDKGFKLAGLELISTEHGATPVDRH